MEKQVKVFFDQDTSTLTYIVYDPETRDAVIFDPVLNYEPNGSTYGYQSAKELLAFVNEKELKVHYIIDTHAHADHITSSFFLKEKLPTAQTVIGNHITVVQDVFKNLFALPYIKTDASQFDVLINDGDALTAGSIEIKAIHTPGHTPTCTSYVIEDMVFTGDALFMPDFGTGRCDFPKGSAKDLYHSIHEKLYALADETKVFVGHDYMPGGRDLAWQTTIKESKEKNIHLKQDTTEEAFIAFRNERDKTLQAPRLLLPSIQINIDAGKLPPKEENGTRYLKMPLTENAAE